MGMGVGYYNPSPYAKMIADRAAWRKHFGVLAEMEDDDIAQEKQHSTDMAACRATVESWGKKKLDDDLQAENARLRSKLAKLRALPI